jgi:hypothetical protein
MATTQFLEYLHEHQATQVLADDLAAVLVMRGRADLLPKPRKNSDSRRIAS